MTNTYPDDASLEEKTYEEIRCARCVLERILRVMDEGLFVDYQMEKFGKVMKDSKNYNKGQITGSYKVKKKRKYQCGDDCKGECSGEVDGNVHCPLATCRNCGVELMAPYDGQPYLCTECSIEEENGRLK